MVESTALEMRRTGNRTVGSNPTLSARSVSIIELVSPKWSTKLKIRPRYGKQDIRLELFITQVGFSRNSGS